MKQSGGTVWVYSEPGRGSVFKVYLRRVEARADARVPGNTRPETPGGSETSLTSARPDIRVLYMSGYTDQAIVNHGVLEPGIAYLEKPFTIPAITRAVRDALDARPVG